MKFLKLLLPVTALLSLAACDNTPEDPVYPKATHLFFSDYSGQQVGVMDVNTLNTYDVVANNADGLNNVSSMTVDFEGGKVYAVEELNNRIVRFNADGSGGLEVLFDESDSVDMPTSIALDLTTRTLYWGNSGTGQLKKGSMDGGTATSLYYDHEPVISYSYGLAIDTKRQVVYYSDLDTYAGVWGAKLDGTGAPTLLVGHGSDPITCRNPSAIFYDGDAARLYWADEGLNAISVTDFSNSKLLFNYEDDVSRADGISIDKGSGKVYWTETAAGKMLIARGSLDGTGDREALLENVEAYSIALKFEEPK